MRRIHHSRRSGVAARLCKPGVVRSNPRNGQIPVDRRRRLGDILDEQPAGAQAARVLQGVKRGGGLQAGRDPDRGIQRAGDHHRDVDLLSDLQQRRGAAQRGDLEHGDVGRLRPHYSQRVVGLADALVRRHRNIDAATDLGEFFNCLAGLFDVFQRPRARLRRGSPPPLRSTLQPPFASTRTVGTSARTASTRVMSSLQRLSGLGDLDLRGPRAGEPAQQLRHLLGRDGRDGGVDRDAVALAGRRCFVGRLDRRCQPVRGLGRPRTR